MSNVKAEHEFQMQQLSEQCEKFEKDWAASKAVNKELEMKEYLLMKQVESFQSALDQSEAELAKCETEMKVKQQLVFELERSKTHCAVTSQQVQLVVHDESTQAVETISQLSPEVITSTNVQESSLSPGPVSLKVATAILLRLYYNIDHELTFKF